MQYALKNGSTVDIRPARTDDAQALIDVMTLADSQSRFLGRNPGEFSATIEKERELIERKTGNPDGSFCVAEYEGKVVGLCSVHRLRRGERFRHRAVCSFILLKECWGLGIGGKMMENCIAWCRENGLLQLELNVVKDNERALRMYQSFGFEIVGTMPRALQYPDGTFADEYMMVKML